MKLIIDYIFKNRVQKNEPTPLGSFEIRWTKIDIDTLKFLHQEASVRVKDTIEDHHSISKKAFSLILLFITLGSVLAGYLLGKNEFHLNVIAIIALIICLLSIYILSELIRPVKFKAPGRVPNKILTNKLYEKNISADDRLKLIFYKELLNCQSQIDLNQYYNTIRLIIIDFVIRLVLITFITLGALLIIFKIIN